LFSGLFFSSTNNGAQKNSIDVSKSYQQKTVISVNHFK
jgi:hypothetical protein